MLLDRGDKFVKELSMAKAFAVQAGLGPADRAVQTHCGIRYLNRALGGQGPEPLLIRRLVVLPGAQAAFRPLLLRSAKCINSDCE